MYIWISNSFRKWMEQGTFRAIFQDLAEDLYERGKIDIQEAFIDGSFAPAKRGVLLSARQSVAKGTKIMAIAEASGLPVAACVESASPHEVKLVEKTIDSGFTQYAPGKLIGDKAYDSDPLDEKLMEERCMEMIAPHRVGRKKAKTQDGGS